MSALMVRRWGDNDLDVIHFSFPHTSGFLCKARPGGFFVDQRMGTPKVTCPRCLELLRQLAKLEWEELTK